MTFRHITTAVVGVSSFCLGILIDRKFRGLNTSQIPEFKIFDAVNADSAVTIDNQQLIIKNEQRISEVSFILC